MASPINSDHRSIVSAVKQICDNNSIPIPPDDVLYPALDDTMRSIGEMLPTIGVPLPVADFSDASKKILHYAIIQNLFISVVGKYVRDLQVTGVATRDDYAKFIEWLYRNEIFLAVHDFDGSTGFLDIDSAKNRAIEYSKKREDGQEK